LDELDRTSRLDGGRRRRERVHELAARPFRLRQRRALRAHRQRHVDATRADPRRQTTQNRAAPSAFRPPPARPSELVDRAESIVFDLSQQTCLQPRFAHIDELLKESFETITKALRGRAATSRARLSGFREPRPADRPAFQPGKLGHHPPARPSMGKSAASRSAWAANVAVPPMRSRYRACSRLEMSKSEVTQRLMCSGGARSSRSALPPPASFAVDGLAAPHGLRATSSRRGADLTVDDTTASITMMEIRSKAAPSERCASRTSGS